MALEHGYFSGEPLPQPTSMPKPAVHDDMTDDEIRQSLGLPPAPLPTAIRVGLAVERSPWLKRLGGLVLLFIFLSLLATVFDGGAECRAKWDELNGDLDPDGGEYSISFDEWSGSFC